MQRRAVTGGQRLGSRRYIAACTLQYRTKQLTGRRALRTRRRLMLQLDELESCRRVAPGGGIVPVGWFHHGAGFKGIKDYENNG